MLFNSVEFFVFFPIVVLAYFLIPKRLKNLWLLLSSYYFYMCWNAKYIVLILFSTIVTYFSGLLLEGIKNKEGIDETRKRNYKKCIVTLCFILNLGVLFYFKYINFALNSIQDIFRQLHIELNIPVFDVLLPVGISFYTFQALSYTMDVYRNNIYAEKNFIQYALFVSFFPQLVAGPIERSKNLLKQLALPHRFNYEKARSGIYLMLWGFFLKIVLADRIAIFVNTVYGDYTNWGGWYLIIATILFAFQIYCDFAGYSTIAMGAAEVLGVTLMENFQAPYLSTSVAEFWRKWHISLTSWFKDYLYIPLGGSRRGKMRKYINKLIVFLASGLWHGAKFSFIAWGCLNGIYQVIGEILQPLKNKAEAALQIDRESMGYKLVQVIGTFLLVDFAWIFFRAQSFLQAFSIIKHMFTIRNPWILFDGSLYQCGLDSKNFGLMIICLCVLLFADICKHRKIKIMEILINQDHWIRWVSMSLIISFILLFGIWGPGYNEANFIYFQF